MMSTNFRNVLATILFNLSVNIMLVRYLVVSRLLPLVAKYAIYRGSQTLSSIHSIITTDV